MSDLTANYKEKIEFLEYISQQICKDLDIKLKIRVIDNDASELNAETGHIKDNIYFINFTSRIFHLDLEIDDITKRYTEDDLLFFREFRKLNIFSKLKDDTYRVELNNLFSTIIILNIFFHECGHIYAKHIEKKRMIEFDSTKKGSYKLQEHELVADWLSTGYLFELIYFNIAKKIKNKDDFLRLFKETIIFYWLSLTIEFEIFERVHNKKPSPKEYSELTHPIPEVRLFYSREAMFEAMINVLNHYNLSDDKAEEVASYIIDDAYVFIVSFLNITDTSFSLTNNLSMVKQYYVTLRDIPYVNGKTIDNFLHLLPLSDELRNALN